MTPETRAFLERVRDAEDPSAADQQRVLAAVRATVAAGALAGVAGAGTSKLFKLLAAWSVPGLKTGPIVLCLLAAAGAAEVPLAPQRSVSNAVVALAKASPRRLPAAPASAALPALPPAAAPAPEPGRARRSPLPRSASRPVASAPLVPGPPSLRRELLFLSDVQSLLKDGDAGAALERLEAHRTPDRELLAERQAARILALCAAGRSGEARQAAAAFLDEHPTSLQHAAIARSCAGHR